MKCSNCSKLASMHSNRNCKKCGIAIYSNICVLCASCSNEDKVCESCLKHIKPLELKYRGCSSCGKK